MRFQVEHVIRGKSTSHVFARQLDAGEVHITAESRLAGVPLQPLLSMSVGVKGDDNSSLDLFAFVFADKRDADKFSSEQIVELES